MKNDDSGKDEEKSSDSPKEEQLKKDHPEKKEEKSSDSTPEDESKRNHPEEEKEKSSDSPKEEELKEDHQEKEGKSEKKSYGNFSQFSIDELRILNSLVKKKLKQSKAENEETDLNRMSGAEDDEYELPQQSKLQELKWFLYLSPDICS